MPSTSFMMRLAILPSKSWSTWTQSAVITATEPGLFDNFGFVVDLDEDLAVIGAPRAHTKGEEEAGAAYVARKIDGAWQVQQLHPSVVEGGARFGDGVAVRDNTIVIGAPREGVAMGAAYVFRPDGAAWMETARLMDPNPETGELFGEDVSVDGDAILVGSFLTTLHGIGGAGTAHGCSRSSTARQTSVATASLSRAPSISTQRSGCASAMSRNATRNFS